MNEIGFEPESQVTGQAAQTSAEVATSAEQRWARRVPTCVGAQITHPRLSAPILCSLRDTSSAGAKLELSVVRGGNISRESVPDRFTLVISGERIAVDCQVAWRHGKYVGVRYTSPSRRLAKQALLRQVSIGKPKSWFLKQLLRP